MPAPAKPWGLSTGTASETAARVLQTRRDMGNKFLVTDSRRETVRILSGKWSGCLDDKNLLIFPNPRV